MTKDRNENNIKISTWLTFLGALILFSAGGGEVQADADITFQGTLIEAPPCIVNNGQKVIVNFGNEVMTTRVDGNNYKQPVAFSLDCSDALSTKQRIRISGTLSEFDTAALSTSQSGLAIALYNGTERYKPGEWINFTDPALPNLQAVPVKEGSIDLPGGIFSALASLIVDYQ